VDGPIFEYACHEGNYSPTLLALACEQEAVETKTGK
jgi:hypothetical protein